MLTGKHADGVGRTVEAEPAGSNPASRRFPQAIVGVGVLAVGLLATVGTASAQHGGGMTGGGYGAFGIPGFGLAFWILLGLGIIGLFAYTRDGRRSRSGGTSRADEGREHSDRAVDTLRERYARGELTDEEFETRRAKLVRQRSR